MSLLNTPFDPTREAALVTKASVRTSRGELSTSPIRRLMRWEWLDRGPQRSNSTSSSRLAEYAALL